MSIRYECHYCHEVFPAESRIDGYAQGYTEGFLCPRCGKNIKDIVVGARQRLNACQIKWYGILVVLAMPVYIASLFEHSFPVAGFSLSVGTIALAVFVLVSGLILIFVPCTRRAGVIVTEPVEKS